MLAHWPSGLGRAAVFTGDATSRWAAAWVKSPFYAKFWAQAVRTVAFTDGTSVACDAIFFSGRQSQQCNLAARLGC